MTPRDRDAVIEECASMCDEIATNAGQTATVQPVSNAGASASTAAPLAPPAAPQAGDDELIGVYYDAYIATPRQAGGNARAYIGNPHLNAIRAVAVHAAIRPAPAVSEEALKAARLVLDSPMLSVDSDDARVACRELIRLSGAQGGG